MSEKEEVVVPEPVGKDEESAPVPSLPKRPLSPLAKAKKELSDAFPNLEDKLITAILIASQGELDKSFNALLYYNDPSTLSDEEVHSLFAPPKLPSRDNQLAKDEEIAKKLARKYSKQERYNNYLLENNKADNKDSFESFMENDLPQFKQQLNKNLEETSTKISNWFGNLNKKFNENTNSQGPLFSAIGTGTGTGSQKSNDSRPLPPRPSSSGRSRSRYDYDSESIIDQTSGIALTDNTNEDIYGTPKKKNSLDTSAANAAVSSSTAATAATTTTAVASGAAATATAADAKTDDDTAASTKKKGISVVKPEPIADEAKKETTKKEADDDFLVDDSDED